jgi:hypothetical protein
MTTAVKNCVEIPVQNVAEHRRQEFINRIACISGVHSYVKEEEGKFVIKWSDGYDPHTFKEFLLELAQQMAN